MEPRASDLTAVDGDFAGCFPFEDRDGPWRADTHDAVSVARDRHRDAPDRRFEGQDHAQPRRAARSNQRSIDERHRDDVREHGDRDGVRRTVDDGVVDDKTDGVNPGKIRGEGRRRGVGARELRRTAGGHGNERPRVGQRVVIRIARAAPVQRHQGAFGDTLIRAGVRHRRHVDGRDIHRVGAVCQPVAHRQVDPVATGPVGGKGGGRGAGIKQHRSAAGWTRDETPAIGQHDAVGVHRLAAVERDGGVLRDVALIRAGVGQRHPVLGGDLDDVARAVDESVVDDELRDVSTCNVGYECRVRDGGVRKLRRAAGRSRIENPLVSERAVLRVRRAGPIELNGRP